MLKALVVVVVMMLLLCDQHMANHTEVAQPISVAPETLPLLRTTEAMK